MSEIDGTARAPELLARSAHTVKVRILRSPPARFLEGVDLGPQPLEAGHVYELAAHVAEVLLIWNYAERIGSDQLPKGAKQFA